MPLNLPDCITVAQELDDARRTGQAIAPPADLRVLSLADAYAIQDSVVALRERGGEVRSGWKLGLTSAVKQQLMGIDHPLFGRLFAAGLVVSGASVPFSAFIAPRVEPEIAFGLAAPLHPDVDEQTLLDSIAWWAPALEITDSRYLPSRRSAVELVADNTSAAAYVIGGRMPLDGALAFDAIGAQIRRNGNVLAVGTSADVLGNPLTALTLLARHLAARGLRMAAGEVVLSGAITDAFPAAPGDRFEGRLDGFASAEVTFV